MSDLEKYRKILDHSSDEPEDEFGKILSKSSDLQLPKSNRKEDIWNKIEEEITEERKSIPIWKYVSVAASILIATTIAFFLTRENPAEILQVETRLAESKTIQLPDGSSVIVNANSSISYNENWNRKITLTGEAFFDVVKGGDFIVSTPIGSVEVLGTSFNVFARDSIFKVSCKTGKVKVDIPSQSFSEDIEPGETITLSLDTVRRSQLPTEMIGKWQSGEFYFNEQLLSNVLQEMERQFDVSLYVPDSTNIQFSGYFTNKSIENALDMVCLPLGLTYQKVNNQTYEIRESE